MTTQNERIHALETDVTVLHRDSALHTKILEKVEVNMDRTETGYEAISRATTVHDEKLKNQEKTNDRIEGSIQEVKENIKILDEKLDVQNDRRTLFLEKMKEDLLEKIEQSIDNRISKVIGKDREHIDNSDRKQYKVFKYIVDNWKYIIFIVAMLVGLVFNKWTLLTSIMTSI